MRRTRLTGMLHGGEGGDLTVVRAAAGFGKTTLLVDLAHEAGDIVSWVALDEWDRDAATFLRYLRLSVVRRLTPEMGRSAPPRRGQGPQTQLAALAAQIADHDERTWIILDDFHALDGSDDVIALIDYFARRLPPNCRLILASRTQPALPSLARQRLSGRVLELGPTEMAFDADEIRYFYRLKQGISITPEQAERVHRFTQGWPAGVALLSDPETLDFPGESSTPLAEYLTAEVFGRLPVGLQEFLLSTSVFESLDSNGCDAILHDSRSSQILRSLESENVPLMRVGGATVEYRVHALLRDYLRTKLRADDPAAYRRLNQEAGEWQAECGRLNEAISHFAEAEDWDRVATLILENAPGHYRSGRWHTVTSWLKVMPLDEMRKRPQVRLWEARILTRLGQSDEALRIVSEAVDSVRESDPILVAELETIRATALRVKGDVGWALVSCRRAVHLAAESNAPIDVLAEARKQLGLVQFAAGSFPEAVRELRSVLDIYEQRGDVEEMAFVNGCLGSALGSLGRLPESVTHLEQARQQWRKAQNVKELSWVLNNLAMIYHLMGQIDLARELFADAVSKARAGGHQQFEAYALVSLADIDRQAGRHQSALERYEQALSLSAELDDMRLSTHALAGIAHTCLSTGDVTRAEALARQALASATERDSPYEEGLALLAVGSVTRQRGQLEEAVSAFTSAAAKFEGVNAKKELAEALFGLADAALPTRHGRSLLKLTLEKLAAVSAELGHDYFLVKFSIERPAVAQYASSRKIAGDFYRGLLRRSTPTTTGAADTAAGSRAPAQGLLAIEVMALGEVEIRMDGRKILDLEWESEKSRELFLLLLSHNRPMRRDEIVAALWPETGGKRATSAFHSSLYRVRRALNAECVVESGGAYALNPAARLSYDVREFERALEMAGATPAGDRAYVDALRTAVDLYRGPFAPSLDSEWADARRLALEERFLEAAAKLADRLILREDYAAAVQVCRRLLECDPYNEAACYKLMQAHAAAGDCEAAFYAYRRYSEALDRDIGDKPGHAISRLYSEVRAQLGRATGSPP